jgi:pyroglutamyl-peptidase
MRRSLATIAAAAVAACAAPDDAAPVAGKDGMFRDFTDGKLDGAGHPLNARVTEAETMCGGELLDGECRGAIDGTVQRGELAINVRVRVDAAPDVGPVIAIRIVDESDATTVEDTITAERIRERGTWFDLSVGYWSDGNPRSIIITPAPDAVIHVDYVESFPRRFGLVASPGSGVLADADTIAFETPLDRAIDGLRADDADLMMRWNELVADGRATRVDTAFRSIFTVAVADLLPDRGDVVQLRVESGDDAARMEVRRAPAPCVYEGDGETRVLITGFQPFPADGWHDNVSEVGVRAVRPAAVLGARVMRLILPVEYDRAAAAVRDAIARCTPDVVIGFGQGGGSIDLEQTAYNLKDTGEVPGGVPDNRGIIAAALAIDPLAPAERTTSLPLDRIEQSLELAGEYPQRSTDPGRYICNNHFFTVTGEADAGAIRRGGFIHLPYTTRFDDDARRRWGRVIETIIRAAL